MIVVILAAFLPMVISGCKPEKIPEPSSSAPSAIIWKYERECKGLASNNYIYRNLIIQGTSSSYSANYKVVALSLDSGKMIWQSGNFPSYFDAFDPEYACFSEGKLIITDRSYTRAINAENGQMLWEDDLVKGGFGVCAIDDYVYKTAQTSQYNELYRYHIHTGERSLLFTLTRAEHGDGRFQPDLRLPVKWVDPNGNELLIVHSRGWDGNNSYRMDVMAWNLTADSMAWYRKGLDDLASSSRPAIEDNRVYLFSISRVFCIDAATGNTLWSFERDYRDDFSGFKTANVLLVKDKLIAKSDSYWMYGLDKMTGERVWAHDKTAPMPYLLREFRDTVWFSSGGVYAVDAFTGRVLIDEWDNNGKGRFWSNPVVHHPTLGYIYTTDGDYIYCLDPKRM